MWDKVKAPIWQYLALIALLIILTSLWVNHIFEPKNNVPVGITVLATPSKTVKSIPTHQATLKKGSVRVYDNVAKIKLDLPKVIIDDEAKNVVASTTVKADDHPQTTTTILNTETGDFETYTKKEPLPWLAWDDHGEVGVYGGIKNGTPTARLEAKQGIFQMKSVHVGVIGSLDQPLSGVGRSDVYLGVGVYYKW